VSVSTKLLGTNLFYAYMAGRTVEQRDAWMVLAREEKAKGKECFLIKQSIEYARKRNRELVQHLKSIRA
jgi:hypothetical protein